MTQTSGRPNTEKILSGLKDFQRDTVEYVFRRFYDDPDPAKRFLIADEVGLGKTLVARGVIAKAIDHLWDSVDRIDIVYICANRDIARQNVNRLNVTSKREIAMATRMTLLPLHLHNLQHEKLNFVSFTPGTSFNLRSATGIAYERALIYHILRRSWDLGNRAGPKNLLQCGAGRKSWRRRLDRFPVEEIDDVLASAYVARISRARMRFRFNRLCERFSHYRQNVPKEDRRARDRLIGDLRSMLAESCVEALEPDIVILDEFQRFKHLLDAEDEVARLANAVFNYPDAKVLLLSATPYKMYTMYHEQETDDHYADFIRTTGFLLGAPERTKQFEGELNAYRRALLEIGGSNGKQLSDAKCSVEGSLRKVMVRTERLPATEDRSGMIAEAKRSIGELQQRDLRAFAHLDRIAKVLKMGDLMEYWKSAPYLLNAMDHTGYRIKEVLVDDIENYRHPELAAALSDARDFLLSWTAIRNYQPIDPCNPRLRTLLAHKVDNGAWKLLWIPASLPYYQTPSGPYAEPGLRHYTKSLVFSSWLIVPKVISMLTSYEAERQMVRILDREADYATERRRRRPLLRFSFEKLEGTDERRATGMSNFLLFYPCATLATEIDPLRIAADLASQNTPQLADVARGVRERLQMLMEPILERYENKSATGAVDERWYWAALALLDAANFRSLVSRWLQTDDEDLQWRIMVRRGDDEGGNFAEHVNLFQDFFEEPGNLGRTPDDLVDVLVKTALGSPAVTALRSLLRLTPENSRQAKTPSEWLLATAAEVAMGFRSLFNLPESITLLRGLERSDDTRYWEGVLNYAVGGNLQAVMDEYVHTLRESLGLIDADTDEMVWQVGEEISRAVSLRTASLEFDEIKASPQSGAASLQRRSIRCRFALRFGDARGEDEGNETRADQVRSAFNSPFRPFILATTSIGQEGLDFHQYCHEIYHWNLPSNPVDLEQREGRIHRYKGHVIRRNVALGHSWRDLRPQLTHLCDPWEFLFQMAGRDRLAHLNELVPFWIFELDQGHRVDRHVPALPLTRDRAHFENLRRTMVAYRMVLGQPRQEDLVKYLESRLGSDLEPDDLLKYRIDLTPPKRLPETNSRI
jgi:hypothetical protein